MHSTSSQRRDRTALAKSVLLACCALALTAASATADTFRSALYELDVPDANALGIDRTSAEPAVYMRVTGADRTTGEASNQLEFSPRKDTSGFALFEFFAVDEAASLSIEQVRFRDRNLARPALSALRGLYGVDRAQVCALGSSLLSGSDDFTTTIDLPSVADRTGLGSENWVGFLFELARGVSIDTLIDQYLAHGILRPEVRLRLPNGERQWLVLKPPACIRPADRNGSGHLQLIGTSAVPAPTPSVPVFSMATAAKRLDKLSDSLWRAIIQNRERSFTFAPRRVRPRAPPQTAV